MCTLGNYGGCNANETALLRQTIAEAERMAERVGAAKQRRPTPLVHASIYVYM